MLFNLDISGSMSGAKWNKVVNSVANFIKKLSEGPNVVKAIIFNAPFLLEPDNTYLGQKPFRTFNGFKYQGGFSDHLPVFVDLLEK